MSHLVTEQLAVSIGAVSVCRDLSISIGPGDRWCILGRNGAGKTTLLHTLAGLRKPDRGSIRFDGQPLDSLPGRQRARWIGMLFQSHADGFPASVMETALTGRHPWLGPLQWESQDDRARVQEALGQVGLDGLAGRMTDTLSGGERQRLALATLLTQNPQVYLLDEPTSHLDLHHQSGMLQLLKQLALQYERALCMSLHDINMAVRCCNRFLLLFGDGDYAVGSSENVLTPENLERLYHHPLRFFDTPEGPAWLPK